MAVVATTTTTTTAGGATTTTGGSTSTGRPTYTEFCGKSNWYESGNDKVVSDNLFALDPLSGKAAWTYQGGLIVNSTIGAGTGRICFVENRSQPVKDRPSRHVNLKAGLVSSGPNRYYIYAFVQVDGRSRETFVLRYRVCPEQRSP